MTEKVEVYVWATSPKSAVARFESGGYKTEEEAQQDPRGFRWPGDEPYRVTVEKLEAIDTQEEIDRLTANLQTEIVGVSPYVVKEAFRHVLFSIASEGVSDREEES